MQNFKWIKKKLENLKRKLNPQLEEKENYKDKANEKFLITQKISNKTKS